MATSYAVRRRSTGGLLSAPSRGGGVPTYGLVLGGLALAGVAFYFLTSSGRAKKTGGIIKDSAFSELIEVDSSCSEIEIIDPAGFNSKLQPIIEQEARTYIAALGQQFPQLEGASLGSKIDIVDATFKLYLNQGLACPIQAASGSVAQFNNAVMYAYHQHFRNMNNQIYIGTLKSWDSVVESMKQITGNPTWPQ